MGMSQSESDNSPTTDLAGILLLLESVSKHWAYKWQRLHGVECKLQHRDRQQSLAAWNLFRQTFKDCCVGCHQASHDQVRSLRSKITNRDLEDSLVESVWFLSLHPPQTGRSKYLTPRCWPATHPREHQKEVACCAGILRLHSETNFMKLSAC